LAYEIRLSYRQARLTAIALAAGLLAASITQRDTLFIIISIANFIFTLLVWKLGE